MALELEEQYDKLYRYCYFRLRHRQQAEDVTQEAILRYLEHYPGLSGSDAMKCLYTIARNLCTDQRRSLPEQPLEEIITGITPEDDWITDLSVRTALRALPPEEQELLLLRYVSQVPMSSIAGLLGISRFSAYRRLKTAAGNFRRALEGGNKP
ncbi:MAG: RNA polymerase sigma factor [Faecousia sp.]